MSVITAQGGGRAERRKSRRKESTARKERKYSKKGKKEYSKKGKKVQHPNLRGLGLQGKWQGAERWYHMAATARVSSRLAHTTDTFSEKTVLGTSGWAEPAGQYFTRKRNPEKFGHNFRVNGGALRWCGFFWFKPRVVPGHWK